MLPRPRQEAARVGVARDRAVAERDDAVGGAEAALEPVLGEHDGGPPLLVDPAQDAEQLVAGDGVELRRRLVEQRDARPPGQRGAERDPLELAAGELVGRAVEEAGDPQRERGLLHPARDRGGRDAAVLEREGQLGADRPHDDLGLGILEQRAGDRGDRRRVVRARVQPADLEPAGELAAMEVRDEPAGGAQQRRLARAARSGQDDELAGGDVEVDVAQRRRARVRVAVADAVEPERAHRPIPRRSANGSSAHAARTAQSPSCGAPAGAPKVGYAEKSCTPATCAARATAASAIALAPKARSWRDHGRPPPRGARRAAP